MKKVLSSSMTTLSIGIKMIASCLLISAILLKSVQGYGFDAGASCSEKTSRKGRAELIRTIPCDLSTQAYCNLPGNAYPWNAVRRFVHENHGLMKRMYGDVRHISVLRDELNNNEIDDDDMQEAATRYSRTAWKRNKNINSENGKARKAIIDENARRMPTRRTTPSTTVTTSSKVSSAETMKIESTTKSLSVEKKKTNRNESDTSVEAELERELVATVEEIFVQLQDDSSESNIRMQEPNGTSAYETIDESEIEANEKKDASVLAINKTEAATISTTLRIFGKNRDKEQEILSTTTMTTPTTSTSTASTTTEGIKLENEKRNTTLKGLNDNIIHDDDTNDEDVDDELDGNVEDDSQSSDSTHSQTIVDLNGKPAVNGVAQLYQDVAEKEDPIFHSSRGVNACPVKEEVVAPFWANNTRGEVLALLNLYPFEQYVHWEKCTHEHKQMYCRDGCRCEQQYRLHRLLAYDPHNECRGIFSDWFKFPSCCICKCYDIPLEYRVTSRSPRSMAEFFKDTDNDEIDAINRRHMTLDAAEDGVYRANYKHVTNEWYRFTDSDDENFETDRPIGV